MSTPLKQLLIPGIKYYSSTDNTRKKKRAKKKKEEGEEDNPHMVQYAPPLLPPPGCGSTAEAGSSVAFLEEGYGDTTASERGEVGACRK